jgi:hypothetical protein
MRSISSSEILGVWERGLEQSQINRGLALLALACPEASSEELAELPIGKRDGIILALHEQIFGPELVCLTTCPSCLERLEMTLNVEDIQARPSDHGSELKEIIGDIEVKFRLPNSIDLMAVENEQDVSDLKQILFERCIIGICQNGEEIAVGQLPARIKEAIEEKMAEADPQSNMNLDLVCPICGNKWQAAFDIVSFLWNEINAWAQRMLQEVHAIASVYGWSEEKILGMSSLRRQAYLDLVSQ